MDSKQLLKQAADGISLMAFFTFFWTFLGEIALEGRDRWLLGVLFGVLLLLLLAQYFKFNSAARKLPADSPGGGGEDPGKKKEVRRFLLIFILTGVAIVVIKKVLAYTGLDAYFIPCFALIVGLHFFLLARLFKQTFYYSIAIYITLVALAGIGLTHRSTIWPDWLITSGVAIGCAIGTALNGLRIVLRANRLIQDDNIAIN